MIPYLRRNLLACIQSSLQISHGSTGADVNDGVLGPIGSMSGEANFRVHRGPILADELVHVGLDQLTVRLAEKENRHSLRFSQS